jgi:hypothetical protein
MNVPRLLEKGWLGTALLALSLVLGSARWVPAAAARPVRARAALSSEAAAAELLGLAAIGHYGGAVQAVAVAGNRAYVGRGPRLEVYDLTDPADPALLGRSALLPGNILDVAVSGSYAYLAASWGGLRVVNIANPAAPVEVAAVTVDTQAPAAAELKLANGKLYVASFNPESGNPRGRLSIFSLTNPALPAPLGGYDWPGSMFGVAVSGNVAYVAMSVSGVMVLDVSNSALPTFVKFVDTPGFPSRLALTGNYAYVADGSGGLTVIDVANPATANVVGNAPIPTNGRDVALLGGYAYVATDGGARVYDLTIPISPTQVGSIFTIAKVVDVDAQDGQLYLAAYEGGLIIASLAAPGAPVQIGTTGLADNALALAVANTLSGNAAFLGNSAAGVTVVGVNNPAAPLRLGNLDTSGWPQGIALSGIFAYAASWNPDLQTLNISNPQAPTLGTTLQQGGMNGLDIFVQGSYAYLAGYSGGLAVLGLSNPLSPTVKGSVNTPGDAYSVVVSGTYAYVADNYSGLQIVDVSEPLTPVIVGDYNTVGTAQGVAIQGSTAFVADGLSGLSIIAAGSILDPDQVGHIDTAGEARKVVVQGQRAYIADGWNGLVVVDISDHTQPVQIGHYQTANDAADVALYNGLIYVADSGGGLFILKELEQTLFLPLLDR